MLAQGQSSSAKRGGLVADVTLGLIFLKKKKTEKLCLVTCTLPMSWLHHIWEKQWGKWTWSSEFSPALRLHVSTTKMNGWVEGGVSKRMNERAQGSEDKGQKCVLDKSPEGQCNELFCLFVCFGEEDWPWANICCESSSFCLRKMVSELTSVPIFPVFYVGCCHSMTWWAVSGQCPGSEPVNPQPPKWNAWTSPPWHCASPLMKFLMPHWHR